MVISATSYRSKSFKQWQRELAAVWLQAPDLLGDEYPRFSERVLLLLRTLQRAEQRNASAAARRADAELRELIASYPAFEVALDDSAAAPLDLEFFELTDTNFLSGHLTDSVYTSGLSRVDVGRWSPQRAAPEDKTVNRFLVVPVWYLTDRAATGRDDPGDKYGNRFDNRLATGKAMISIPDRHSKGAFERPDKILWTFELTEDPARHFTVREAEELDEKPWLDGIRHQLDGGSGEDTSRDVLLFVHGYSTTWKNAVMRAAQLAHDVQFEGATVAYTWSSRGTKGGYIADIAAVSATRQFLRHTIDLLIRDSGARRVHVIAHSMGNRALIDALRDVAQTPFPKASADLKNLVFAAPDVNASEFKTFVDDYYKHLHLSFNRKSSTPSRLTLYACGRDGALGISKFANKIPRAGDTRDGILVSPPMDTIDVTAALLPGADTHAYFVSNREILSDLFQMLRGKAPTDRPGLDSVTVGKDQYWKMRA